MKPARWPREASRPARGIPDGLPSVAGRVVIAASQVKRA